MSLQQLGMYLHFSGFSRLPSMKSNLLDCHVSYFGGIGYVIGCLVTLRMIFLDVAEKSASNLRQLPPIHRDQQQVALFYFYFFGSAWNCYFK